MGFMDMCYKTWRNHMMEFLVPTTGHGTGPVVVGAGAQRRQKIINGVCSV